MKKVAVAIALAIVLAGAVMGYMAIVVSDYSMELGPGDTSSVVASVFSNEKDYHTSIDCELDKYDKDGNFIATVINNNVACDTPGNEITVGFDDGSVEKSSQSGNNYYEITMSLASDAAEGYIYRYTMRAGTYFTEAAITTDISLVPEFTAITAGVALVGAGIGYFALRKKR